MAIGFVLIQLMSSTVASAQRYSSDQERFTVNQIRGCAPLSVEALEGDIPPGNTSNPIYKFNYDGDRSKITFNRDQDQTDTTYEVSGIYKILQIVGDELDSITIEVLEPRPPQFRVFNCINNSVYVEVRDDYYDQLEIDFGDGSPVQVVDTDQPARIHRYAQSDTYPITVQGLFENADSQNCAVADTTISTIDELTTADLTAVSVESNTAVRVRYELPNPNVSYRLEVAEAGVNDFTFAQFDIDSETETRVDDPRLRTREQVYCFRVVAINRCDPTANLPSERVCSISLQVEPRNLQNQLTWQTQGFEEFAVTRDEEPLTRTEDAGYLDTDVACVQTYLYQVSSESDLGTSTSEAIAVEAISVTESPAPDSLEIEVDNTQLSLIWNVPPVLSEYYVYRGSDGEPPTLYETKTLDGDTTLFILYEDEEVAPGVEYCYQLAYRNDCGVESVLSDSLCAMVPAQGDVFFPNAFTPNGDGLNDTFVYISRLVEEIDFQVYNRWGELIFQTDQLDEGWDGRYQGVPSPQGTYLYKVEVTDQLGKRFTRQGQFVLLGR